MPTIVYQTNPSTGAKYAYESVSYWDKDKKAPRSKRRYLGRVDPETGEIIESRRNRKKQDAVSGVEEYGQDVSQLMEELRRKDAEISDLKDALRELTLRHEETARILKEIRTLVLSVKVKD